MSSSARSELFRGKANAPLLPVTYGSTEGKSSSPEEALDIQRQTISLQDESLQELSGGVKSVRQIAGFINHEVVSQNAELDGIAAGMNGLNKRIGTAGGKVEGMAQSVYNIRSFCLLLWPLVLLIVLVVEAVIHFIF